METKKLNGFLLLLVILGSTLYGCRIQHEYTPPLVKETTAFSSLSTDSLSIADTAWWNFFNDTVLTNLIEQGLNENLPLKNIIIGIKQAQLQLKITRSQLVPSINYGLEAGSTLSATSLGDAFTNTVAPGIQVSYIVDVWGRIKNQNEAALQAYLATEMAVFEVKAALVAQIAELYFTLRDIDNKILVSKKMEVSMQSYQEIMSARYNGGFISKVDLNQVDINLKNIQVTIQALERARVQLENALSLVIGNLPQEIPRGKKLQEQVFPSALPAGVPGNLLLRRPSLLKTELDLKAQLAKLGPTEALKYPNFVLNFNLGAELLNPAVLFGNLVGNIAGPIFNGNRIKNTIALEKEQYNRLVLDYEQAWLLAVKEVEDALIAIRTYENEVDIRANQLALAEEAYNLAWVRYNEGASSILEFLNIQTNLYSVQLSASESYKNQLQSIVQLYLALGGGWAIEEVNE